MLIRRIAFVFNHFVAAVFVLAFLGFLKLSFRKGDPTRLHPLLDPEGKDRGIIGNMFRDGIVTVND